MSRGPSKKSSPAEEIASECLAGRIRMLNRTITALYDDALRPLGITAGQLNLLTFVTKDAPIAPSELTRLLNMEKSTVSRNLSRMERNGWITIGPGRAGNTQLVEVTARGRSTLSRAQPLWRAAQDEARQLLGPRGADAIRRVFDTVWSRSEGR